MSWNGILEDKPMLYLQHGTLEEAIEKNQYVMEEDLENFFMEQSSYSEEILTAFGHHFGLIKSKRIGLNLNFLQPQIIL